MEHHLLSIVVGFSVVSITIGADWDNLGPGYGLICPESTIYMEHSQRCIHLYEHLDHYNNSKQICQDINAHLVTVRNERHLHQLCLFGEQEFSGGLEYFYLDAQRDPEDGTKFKWNSNHEQVNFSKIYWHPENSKRDQPLPCLQMFVSNTYCRLNDAPCNLHSLVVCESTGYKNPCAAGNGGCPQTCVLNGDGSHFCKCKGKNFHYNRAEGTCQTGGLDVDIDCSVGDNDGCGHKCVSNETGASSCVCNEGFRLVGLRECEDLNECDRDRGGCQQRCVNTYGSFLCLCYRDYKLNETGYCSEIDVNNAASTDDDNEDDYDYNILIGKGQHEYSSSNLHRRDGFIFVATFLTAVIVVVLVLTYLKKGRVQKGVKRRQLGTQIKLRKTAINNVPQRKTNMKMTSNLNRGEHFDRPLSSILRTSEPNDNESMDQPRSSVKWTSARPKDTN